MIKSGARIAIVTGVTSGIGEATVRKLIASGIYVVGNGRKEQKLEQLQRELGATFKGIAGDASDMHVIDSLFNAAVQSFGREADIVIANAGRGLGGSVATASIEQFEQLLK